MKIYAKISLISLILICFSTKIFAESSLQQWFERQKQHDERLKSQDLNQRPIFRQRITQAPSETSFATATKPQHLRLGQASKVNLNTASAEEIVAKLEGIGLKKAQAVVEYRQQHGGFKTIDEFKQVKGIGDKAFARNEKYLTVD